MKKKLLSKNGQYIVACTIIIGIFVFFFSSRAWIADDRERKDYQYDETLTLNNSWLVKVSKADYNHRITSYNVCYTKLLRIRRSVWVGRFVWIRRVPRLRWLRTVAGAQ